MKKTIGLLIGMLIWVITASSQVLVRDGLYFNPAGRQVWIMDMQGKEYPRALLYKVSKDSLFFVETMSKKMTSESVPTEIKSIHYSQVKSLVTLRNSPGKQGALVGGILGIPLGIGINALADQTVESTPVLGSWFVDAYDQPSMVFGSFVLGAGIGAGVGALLGGLAKRKWEIDGFYERYQEAILDLDKRAFWSRTAGKRRSSN
ncbi:hypothetical protein [Algoriphagus taiwanensis]|uniref:Glycine zipper family protein n=1 Tax=Algoriphagus taiwanensis TaxID=1445656 RepID=A0ABQ6Q0E5_9BACT|nr:hypothetical protein Ataiwa_07840 [Algoriphagus taiwanensis]